MFGEVQSQDRISKRDHRDCERLTGCIECNCWRGDKSPFMVELSVEDFAALRGLGIWSASAFNSMMTHEKQWKLCSAIAAAASKNWSISLRRFPQET